MKKLVFMFLICSGITVFPEDELVTKIKTDVSKINFKTVNVNSPEFKNLENEIQKSFSLVRHGFIKNKAERDYLHSIAVKLTTAIDEHKSLLDRISKKYDDFHTTLRKMNPTTQRSDESNEDFFNRKLSDEAQRQIDLENYSKNYSLEELRKEEENLDRLKQEHDEYNEWDFVEPDGR